MRFCLLLREAVVQDCSWGARACPLRLCQMFLLRGQSRSHIITLSCSCLLLHWYRPIPLHLGPFVVTIFLSETHPLDFLCLLPLFGMSFLSFCHLNMFILLLL